MKDYSYLTQHCYFLRYVENFCVHPIVVKMKFIT